MTKPVQRLWLFAACVCFACLFFSGGARLIAAPQAQRAEPSMLCGADQLACIAAAGAAADVQTAAQPDRAEAGRCDKGALPETGRMSLPAPIEADANGNALGGMDYLEAVYLVFVSGDGFA